MRLFQSAAMAAILGLGALTASVPAPAQAHVFIGVSVGYPPPPLPIYIQPPIPGPDYIWTPGFWAWDGFEYYWVPGTWVLAPEPGFLWTPAYWEWDDGVYLFHDGYWGLQVGFYGGIDYGFGYTGFGYDGGYWNHGQFFYNRAVNNIANVNITNVYNRPVMVSQVSRVSYRGGPGGVNIRPTPAQLAAVHEVRRPATWAQRQHQSRAAATPALRAPINHGLPPIAATARPAVLHGPGVVPAAHAAAVGALANRAALFVHRGSPVNMRRGLTTPGSAYAHLTPRYRAPAAENYRRAEIHRYQHPYSSWRGHEGYAQRAAVRRESMAPPRMAYYPAHRAPNFYGGGFAAERRWAPPPQAFRGGPGMLSGGERSAARSPQGGENVHRGPRG